MGMLTLTAKLFLAAELFSLFLILFLIYKKFFASGIIIYLIFILNFIGLIFYSEVDVRYLHSVVYFFLGINLYVFGIIVSYLFSRLVIKKHDNLEYEGAGNKLPNEASYKKLQIVFFLSVVFLIVGAFYYSRGAPVFSANPDYMRFKQQTIPFYGFVYRTIYWILPCISIMLLFFTDYYRSLYLKYYSYVYILMVFLLINLTGSKGAVLHLIVLYGLYFSYKSNNKFSRRIKFMFVNSLKYLLIGIVSLYIVLSLTMINSGKDNISDAFSIILDRLTAGSAEGFAKITTDFVETHGFGKGWYTFIKPFYTMGGTLRLIPKNELTADTGSLVARVYRGDDNLAPLTFTIFGEGYLDFGLMGIIIYGFIFGFIMYLFFELARSNRNNFSYVIIVGIEWTLISLASWGYIDGWIVFALIYVVFLSSLVFVFHEILPSGKVVRSSWL